jgi:ribonuclease HII
MNPNFNEEKLLWSRGFKFVAGLDEVGRGPLAGPVLACAVVVLQFPILNFKFSEVKDSKKLTPEKREELYKILIKHPQIKYGIGQVSEKIIDKINIFEATKLAMQKSLENLDCRPDCMILDGNFEIKSDIPQKSIIKGGTKVFSVACASIIAKVTRDRMMKKLHKKYPEYGFDKHKGYGTALHFEMLKKYGPCKIHRKSFYPVSQI